MLKFIPAAKSLEKTASSSVITSSSTLPIYSTTSPSILPIPSNSTFKSSQRIWQELKESLANSISNTCFSLDHLQQLHSHAISLSLHRNLYISSLLINKYCSFGWIQSARHVFDDITSRYAANSLVWNSMMRGYLKNRQPRSVLDLYTEMVGCICECMPDNQTFNIVITACSDLGEIELGSRVHAFARDVGLEFDLLVGTALVSMYCKVGLLETACKVFDGMGVKDVVAWNAMISGFSRGGLAHEVLNMFKMMRFVQRVFPTEETMVSVVSACGVSGLPEGGGIIHAHAVKIGFETNLFVCNSLVEMYIKCGCLNSAFKIFNRISAKNDVSWSTMIGGYVRRGLSSDALQLFHEMIATTNIQPTRPILLNVLLACADLGDWQQGKQIEDYYIKSSIHGFESDACLNTALIYMYAKCEKTQTSLNLLERIHEEGECVIAWNAMIKACVERGQVDRALSLSLEMQRRGMRPDHITFLTLLPLFSSTSLLTKGMEAHAHVIKRGFESKRSVAHSLIDMYAKCGSIDGSIRIFNRILDKDVESWSLMIKSYAWNGCGREAADLFFQMKEIGINPNRITLLAVLTACSHAGLVEEGRELFKSMKEDYGLEPDMEHYACVVDLLCRGGLLSEAYELVESRAKGACSSVVLWSILLSACRVHGDLGIGEEVAKRLFHLEPENAANFLTLANIYIDAGRRDDANEVLRLLREKGLTRNPGCSWVEQSIPSIL
ncbi:hypothetical protein AAC387_Pa02g3849 [Persea americana]